MPSAPGYVRDYDREWETARARGEGRDNRLQHRLRFKAQKAGVVRKGDGKDLAHKVGARGRYRLKDVTPQTKGTNRSFRRDSRAGLRSEYSLRERGGR